MMPPVFRALPFALLLASLPALAQAPGGGAASAGSPSTPSSRSSSQSAGGGGPDALYGLKPATTTRVFTLDDALSQTVRANYDLRIAKERIEQQHAQLKRAWSMLLPQASIGASYTYSFPEQRVAFGDPEQTAQQALLFRSIADIVEQSSAFNPDPAAQKAAAERAEELRRAATDIESAEVTDIVLQPPHAVSGQLQINMPLFHGRAIPTLMNAYKAVDVSRIGAEQARAGLLFAAARSYYAAITAEKMAIIADTQAKNAATHRDRTAEQAKLGLITPLALERAELEVVRAEDQARQARHGVQLAKGALGVLMGVDEDFQLAPPPAVPVVEASAPLETLVARAWSARDDVRLQKAALEIADNGRLESWMQFLPSLSVAFQGRYTSNTSGFSSDPFTGAVLLQANIPIYDGGASYAGVRHSASRVREELLKLRQLEEKVAAQVRGNVADIGIKQDSLKSAQHAVQLATRSKEQAERLYALGAATNLDVLDANFSLFVAETDLARAELELEQARLGLAYMLGDFRPIDDTVAPAPLEDGEVHQIRDRAAP